MGKSMPQAAPHSVLFPFCPTQVVAPICFHRAFPPGSKQVPPVLYSYIYVYKCRKATRALSRCSFFSWRGWSYRYDSSRVSARVLWLSVSTGSPLRAVSTPSNSWPSCKSLILHSPRLEPGGGGGANISFYSGVRARCIPQRTCPLPLSQRRAARAHIDRGTMKIHGKKKTLNGWGI